MTDADFAESLTRLTKAGYVGILMHNEPIKPSNIRKYWMNPRLRDKLEIYYTPLGELYRQRQR